MARLTPAARLRWMNVLALVGLLGLLVVLFTTLPDAADEVMRREAQSRLERAVAALPETLKHDTHTFRKRLKTLAEDPDVTAMATRETPQNGEVGLAKRLTQRFSLDNLVLIDHSGLLRSLYPDTARVGLVDPARLELAKAATADALMAPPGGRIAHGLESVGDAPLATFAVAEPVAGGRLWVLAKSNVYRSDLEAAALRLGVALQDVIDPNAAPATEALNDHARLIPFDGLGGARILSVIVQTQGDGGRVVRDLIIRRLLLTATPWVLVFAIVLILAGWPGKDES